MAVDVLLVLCAVRVVGGGVSGSCWYCLRRWLTVVVVVVVVAVSWHEARATWPSEVGPEDVACDLGCGLGGWCVEAAKCGDPGDPWLASQGWMDGPMEPC